MTAKPGRGRWYSYEVRGWRFRISRNQKTWSAKVWARSRWRIVTFPSGLRMAQTTKENAKHYLTYAYGGQDKQSFA